MLFRRLTPDNQLRLHLAKAQEYWREDRLGLANEALRQAQKVGFPPGALYDFQRMLEAEQGAREAGRLFRTAEHLIIEGDPARWGEYWQTIVETACVAARTVEETLDVRWGRPILLTLIPDNGWVSFMRARYGYYAARTDSHKVCLPPMAIQNPIQFRKAVLHEIAHGAVHQLAGENVPRWLNEGIAVTMEGGTAWAGEPRRLPLDQLSGGFESYDMDLGSQRAQISYACVGEFTKGLLKRQGWQGLRNLLVMQGEGRRVERAFREVYGDSLSRLEREWIAGK